MVAEVAVASGSEVDTVVVVMGQVPMVMVEVVGVALGCVERCR